jgi:hypothetical protein
MMSYLIEGPWPAKLAIIGGLKAYAEESEELGLTEKDSLAVAPEYNFITTRHCIQPAESIA